MARRRRRRRVKQKNQNSRFFLSLSLSLSHCNVCPCRALTLSSFLPSFLPFFLCLRHYFLTLQIFKSPELFLYPTPEGNVWINPHNTVQTQRERERERISRRLLQIQTKQTALGNDRRLCIRICYQRTN
jgi:hypothetical protein